MKIQPGESLRTKNAELQKELAAKNRGLEIEAALECVRARALAMQHSDELAKTAYILFRQFMELGEDPDQITIGIINEAERVIEFWITLHGNQTNLMFKASIDEPTVMHKLFTAWKEKKRSLVIDLSGEALSAYLTYRASMGGTPGNNENTESRRVINAAFFSKGFITISAPAPRPIETIRILERFAGVFEGTYTRFLDLKRAEAQAREAEVQLALERVRARTMAMQKSDELKQIIQIVYEQFVGLDILIEHAGFIIDHNTRDDMNIWLTDKRLIPSQVTIPYFDSAHWNSFNEAKEKGIDFFANKLTFEEKNRFYQDLFESTPGVPDDTKEYYFSCPGLAISTVLLDNIGLYIENFSGIPYTNEENNTLMRFGKVFQQTYTRFNDLKQAEEQARESQIQLALERVRARTMAMQHSDELAETAYILFQQFRELGENPDQATIGIVNEAEDVIEYWVTIHGNQTDRVYKFPIDEPNVTHKIYKAWKAHHQSLVIDLSGKALHDFSEFRESMGGAAYNPDEKRRIINVAFFSKGLINVQSTVELSVESLRLLKRFANVFEGTYTRFLDLKKAEAQAREAQIELALERVRAKTMAMQHSEELLETSQVVFQQLRNLGETADQIGIAIVREGDGVFDLFATLYGTQMVRVFQPKIDDPFVMGRVYKNWKAHKKSFVVELRGEQLRQYNILRNQLGGQNYYKENIGADDRWSVCCASFSRGILSFSSSTEPNKEAALLLERFAKVFEQTYTRFIDLQKAEEQAREAQIELSLERVRAKTMAMHTSEHVGDTVATMFDELVKLGIEKTVRCGVLIIDETKHMEVWTAAYDPDGKVDMLIGRIDMMIHPLISSIHQAWKNKEHVKTYALAGEDLKAYYRAINDSPGYPVQFDLASLPAKQTNNAFFFPEGAIFAFTLEPLSEYAVKLFKRFAGVFGLTYRRFLDLQKAEEQAREAKIETSLERVRSKTMAMHNSEHVAATVATMFDELVTLGIDKSVRCGIGIIDETKHMEVWTAYSDPGDGKVDLVTGHLDMTSHQMLNGVFNNWKKKELHSTYTLTGKDQADYYKAINSDDYSYKFDITSLPAKQFQNAFYFREGFIYVFSHEQLAADEVQIYKRFAGVFGLTYRRYLDLKQAEEQARESKIEASLERVRGRAMAMRNTDDLSATTSMVFAELRNIGINPIRSGVGLITKESRKARIYSNTSSQTAADLALMGEVTLSGHPVFEQQYKSWLSQKNYYAALGGKELASYYKILSTGLNAKLDITVKKNRQEYGHWFMFSEGFLYAWSDKEYNEAEFKILERFKNVIELTFRRYVELQKSEAQAREAVRQASLDRVRAEIASMRTISDLDRITPLIWNELTILGVPFIRCGVFIMDEPLELIHTYLSTPDGKAIAAFQLHFSADTGNGVNSAALRGWRQKQVVTLHWTGEEFRNFSHSLVEQGELASEESYLTEHPPSGLDLHFFPFLQGMLYAGNTEPLSDNDQHLVQSLADAFSTAYARYEDFNRLELAKQQVENTLTDLKATQTKLIQSEKMASLGELTAGIAHEIQNPLNFVNNFSEVNQEMIAELEEELNAGNIEEALAIAADIKKNEQKINHHGKRADGIVKGMLQHSRTSSGDKAPTNINSLADEFMRLSYHGLRAKDKSFNAEMITNFDAELPKIAVIGQDIGRVFLNLFNNAFYAVNLKKKTADAGYSPTIKVTTYAEDGHIVIKVNDNGIGMPDQVKDKIMQPFFTTKPTGEGTGLGLSLTYDMVVKGHGGSIQVNSIEGEGSEFIITLPLH